MALFKMKNESGEDVYDEVPQGTETSEQQAILLEEQEGSKRFHECNQDDWFGGLI
jgi:hypothetical protein